MVYPRWSPESGSSRDRSRFPARTPAVTWPTPSAAAVLDGDGRDCRTAIVTPERRDISNRARQRDVWIAVRGAMLWAERIPDTPGESRYGEGREAAAATDGWGRDRRTERTATVQPSSVGGRSLEPHCSIATGRETLSVVPTRSCPWRIAWLTESARPAVRFTGGRNR